jgi:hypothetical protein
MKFVVTRNMFLPTRTLSTLTVFYDGDLAFAANGWRANNPRGPLEFGFVCEDQDRGLDQAEPATWTRKVKASTAIPIGTYELKRTWSPKYGKLVMQLLNVPAFEGIRVHPGNDETDTKGCPLPGLGRTVAGVSRSTDACTWLDLRVQVCEARGEKVTWSINRDGAAWAARSA